MQSKCGESDYPVESSRLDSNLDGALVPQINRVADLSNAAMVFRRISCRWLFIPFLALFLSCAKVGDPLPPLVRIPQVVDVRLVQQAQDRLQLLVPPTPGDIQALEIYKECGKNTSREFQGDLVAQVAVANVEKDPIKGSFVLEDPEPRFDEPCRYQVRARNRQGRRSPPSAILQTITGSPPGAPVNLSVDVQQEQIVVRWEAPSTNLDGSEPGRIVGYLVNSIHVVSGTQFVDREIVFGVPVSYSVQSIGNLENPMVLSRPVRLREFTPEDRFPPAVPSNVTAVPLDSKVQLLWDEVADSQLAGYFVYRGNGKDRLEKSSSLVTINRYVDSEPQAGSVLYYAVAAVDKYGNESALSEYVSVNVDR